MTVSKPVSDCRFCSVISKANGEDPIGSANTFDQCLVIEIEQPWERALWLNHPQLQPIYQTVTAIYEEQKTWTRLLAIAPDRNYTQPNFTRLLFFRRPNRLFATYDKQEFLIPSERMSELAIALLTQSEHLVQFDAYRQDIKSRDILVCTHGNVDVACARYGNPIYETLRRTYATEALRVWRCSHFGGHRFAPTLIDLPTGQYWGHLEPEILDTLIHHPEDGSALSCFYRGWAGVSHLGQVAEREIWLREGKKWLSYNKAEQILAIDSVNEEWEEDWAEIQIDFAAPDGKHTGSYQARVEAKESVMTLTQSDMEESLESVKQYCVTHLRLL